MSKPLFNLTLYYLLLSIFIKPVISVNYFFLGLLGFTFLAAALLWGSDTTWFPGRGLLSAMYLLPFYLIHKAQYVPGYGWLVLQNLVMIAIVLLIWRDENFLAPPYLSPASPYRELDLAVPLAIFFYVGSLIVVPAMGPKLVNWNQVQHDSLLAFEGLFFYFVITRYFTEKDMITKLAQSILIAFLAIALWGGVNLFTTYQSLSRARFYSKQEQITAAVQYLENTEKLNRITNIKRVQKDITQLKTRLLSNPSLAESD